MLNRFVPAGNRRDAGARDFDEADRTHHFDEIVDLARRAGQFENEAHDVASIALARRASAKFIASMRLSPLPRTLIIASSHSIARTVRSDRSRNGPGQVVRAGSVSPLGRLSAKQPAIESEGLAP